MGKRIPFHFASFLLMLVVLAACTVLTTPTPTALHSPTPEPAIDLPPEITPTEVVVYVAVVNGEGIRQTSYAASMKQFLAAQEEFGNLLEPGETAQDKVMLALINRVLLAQAARDSGFVLDPSMVDDRFAQITEEAGGPETLASWLENNGYTLESFRIDLALEIEAAWQREQIASSVPETAEQVKARQVLFYDSFLASRAYNQLQAGVPFDTIVENNDPQKLGYLDWFPRGYLFYSQLEEVAFSLQPGEYSEVIETVIGYHILEVLDYDPGRLLSTDARLTKQIQVLEDWLAQQRAQSQIEIYLP